MKRFLVISAIALVTFAAQAQAQEKAGSMYAGIKAGANFGDVGGSDADTYFKNTSMHTGFMGGLFAGKHINANIGARIEALWVQKGVKSDQSVTVGSTTETVSATTKLDYIEFPILFVYDFPAGEKLGFNLFAGPTLGFNIKGKAEANGQSADIKDQIKSFEFGGAIGAGLEHQMANGKGIGIDVRYSMGATNVPKDITSNGTTVSPSVKNRGIGVMASFSVPLGKSAAK